MNIIIIHFAFSRANWPGWTILIFPRLGLNKAVAFLKHLLVDALRALSQHRGFQLKQDTFHRNDDSVINRKYNGIFRMLQQYWKVANYCFLECTQHKNVLLKIYLLWPQSSQSSCLTEIWSKQHHSNNFYWNTSRFALNYCITQIAWFLDWSYELSWG